VLFAIFIKVLIKLFQNFAGVGGAHGFILKIDFRCNKKSLVMGDLPMTRLFFLFPFLLNYIQKPLLAV